jgi:hypothetical protein
MAKGRSGAGNRGNSGRPNYGRSFKVLGRKPKRKAGRPRKARAPLTSAFFTGARPEPVSDPVDIEDSTRHGRKKESKSK